MLLLNWANRLRFEDGNSKVKAALDRLMLALVPYRIVTCDIVSGVVSTATAMDGLGQSRSALHYLDVI